MHRILLLDSGVGGLSILDELLALMPSLHIHYIADQKHFPYGEKSEDWLNERVLNVLTRHTNKHPCDVIVIACNTASTATLDTLRSHFKIPIVGVVPAIKTAASASETKQIGVLATPGTVKRSYLKNLIQEFAPEHQVKLVGSTELVKMAETAIEGTPPCPQTINDIIKPFIDEPCDQVVLGCTHFPLLKQHLSDLAPKIQWVDSGKAVAKRVQSLLPFVDQNMNGTIERRFFSSAPISDTLLQNLMTSRQLIGEYTDL